MSEVAHEVSPDAHIVHVDNDPVVYTHGKALLADFRTTDFVLADARKPAEILADPTVAKLLDFTRPVGLMMFAIVELAADPATPDLPEIPWLLAGLTVGHNCHPVARLRAAAADGARLLEASLNYVDEDEDGDAENARFYRYCETLDRGESDRLYAHIALTAYEGVRAGLPLIRSFVAHAEAAVRTAAAYILAWFPEEAAASLPLLMPAAADSDAQVAATALAVIGLLETPGTSEAVPVLEAALDDPRDVVRWGAATALARLRGRDAGEKAIGELHAWADRTSGPRQEIPYNHGASVSTRNGDCPSSVTPDCQLMISTPAPRT